MGQKQTRRHFFKGADGTLGLLGSLPATSLALVKKRSFDDIVRLNQVFRHGLASGDPLQDRVIIWTRVSKMEGGGWVRWQVAEDPEFYNVILEGEVLCERAKDFTVKVDVNQLQAGRSYYYRFYANGVWSMVGRTKTASIDSTQLRIGVVSCSSIWSGYMNAYDRLADRNDLDLIIHCGDYIYEVPDPNERLIMPHEPLDEMKPGNLEEMRRRYA